MCASRSTTINPITVTTTPMLMLAAIVLYGCVALSSCASASDNSLSDLYSNLLQREYTGPISFPNHQVERKAQRSPSLRLRFGRRSDSTFPIFGNRFSKYIEEINKKPIRSPSLRLRFGKRDPMYNDDYYSNELNDVASRETMTNNNNRWPLDQLVNLNAPLSVGSAAEQPMSEQFDAVPEKRKPVHLRFGRSSNSVHEDIPNIDRPTVLNDDAVAIPRLKSQSPKAGDLVSVTGY